MHLSCARYAAGGRQLPALPLSGDVQPTLRVAADVSDAADQWQDPFAVVTASQEHTVQADKRKMMSPHARRAEQAFKSAVEHAVHFANARHALQHQLGSTAAPEHHEQASHACAS